MSIVWTVLAFAALVFVVMVANSRLVLAQDAPAGSSEDSVPREAPVTAGGLQWLDPASPGDSSGHEALALSTRLDVTVRGALADLTLRQRFQNDSGAWRDARYAFPMPDGAMVRGLTIRTGDRVIRGEVLEKEAARERFDKAASRGQIASLVSAARPNLFNTRISALAPGSTMDIELNVLLPIAIVDEEFALVLPTTLTPRFVDPASSEAVDVLGPVVASPHLHAPPRVHLTLHAPGLASIRSITSSSHTLDYRDKAVILDDLADRDILLRWPVSALDSAGADLHGGVWNSVQDGAHYVQFLLTPPDADALESRDLPARELILILDRSGSMAGAPMVAAQAAIVSALAHLRPADRFNVIAFDDGLYPLFTRSRHADTQTISLAQAFVSRMHANGGTVMGPALHQAIRSSEDARYTQLVFITDGSIGYEDTLLSSIKRTLGARRLFAIGIGSASNRWFLDKAAETGRGKALFVADVSGIEQAMEQLLEQLSRPVLTDLQVSFQANDGRPLEATMYPDPIPDLYAGRPVMVLARLPEQPARVSATGRDEAGAWSHQWPVLSSPANSDAAPAVLQPDADPAAPQGVRSAASDGLASWWAARRIEHLSDLQRGSTDPQRHREDIVRTAMAAKLVSQYTSFVAVSQTVSRPASEPAHDMEVANIMPAGNTMQSVQMPVGASGVDSLLLASTLSTLLGTGLLFVARDLRAA